MEKVYGISLSTKHKKDNTQDDFWMYKPDYNIETAILTAITLLQLIPYQAFKAYVEIIQYDVLKDKSLKYDKVLFKKYLRAETDNEVDEDTIRKKIMKKIKHAKNQ
ncbi:hypothetical protein [Flavobacteriaceae bacterium 14752]|uniref:hypothetical protein n=1 Tax=Mesohalobacter salilacus TaxID=2491711 RepID=UPI000F62DAC7|nr:hypothetical protein EIG84_05810 [Flavobacteriaceae bacterium 14752]